MPADKNQNVRYDKDNAFKVKSMIVNRPTDPDNIIDDDLICN